MAKTIRPGPKGPHLSKEARAQAVARIQSGEPLDQVAASCNVSPGTLRGWVKLAGATAGPVHEQPTVAPEVSSAAPEAFSKPPAAAGADTLAQALKEAGAAAGPAGGPAGSHPNQATFPGMGGPAASAAGPQVGGPLPPQAGAGQISPKQLVALLEVVNGIVVRGIITMRRAEFTKAEVASLTTFDRAERDSLESLAPFAAPYVSWMLQNMEVAGAVLFAGLYGIGLAERIKRIDARRKDREEEPRDVEAATPAP